MRTRQVGDGLEVSAIGYGALDLSPGVYGDVSEQEAVAALACALDLGITLIDTSDQYGLQSHNERLIGRFLRGRRDEVVLATKFGLVPVPGEPGRVPDVAFDTGPLRVNARPEHVRSFAEASLQRLGTDHVDLYSLHFSDPGVPIEETVGAMARLVDAGLVRHLGLSNVRLEHVRRAHPVHPIAAIQIEWSLAHRPPQELIAFCREQRIGIVAWWPLGGGFLAGPPPDLRPGDIRRSVARISPITSNQGRRRWKGMRHTAAELRITPAQLALAWLLHQYEGCVPIPGSRNPRHIAENTAAADVVLEPDAIARIDRAISSD